MRLIFSVFLLFSIQTFAQKGYQFKIDLTKVVDDRIYVEVSTPKISTDETIFYLPKIIPGTYTVADYGRFVVDLKALDRSDKELATEKVDVNGWKIKNAKKLTKITYWLDDVVDTEVEGPKIYPMAATSFENNKVFLLNTSGLFGYLDNNKNVPVKFDIVRTKDMYGSTGLIATDTGVPLSKMKKDNQPEDNDKVVDKYTVENYDRLIDSPLLYSQPDTAVVRVANAEVLVGSYSPNHKINSKEIAATVKEVLLAQSKYLGGKLPVDKYAFIFYFTDKPINIFGALEHSYSSLYYMPEYSVDQIKQQLRDFAAHEFFHIVTPLNIHSKEIHHFEFNNPKMSRHLWMYEGVTEYFAGNVQVKYGLITQEDYLKVIRGKMNATRNYRDDITFTDLSQYTLEKYGNQYGNVYQKGALIGMCLDIKLRKLSNGKYGVQNMMADLSKKYGKDQPFDDDQLFDIIQQLTYPEIGDFFRRYVGGLEPLPFKEVFNDVGVTYVDERETEPVYSIGFTAASYAVEEIEGKKRLVLANEAGFTPQGKALGFQVGDVPMKINGADIPDVAPGFGAFLNKQRDAMKDHDMVTFTVLRKDASGTYKPVELQAKAEKVKNYERNVLQFDENATPEQLAVRKAWLSPE